jgi:shikimate kinase
MAKHVTLTGMMGSGKTTVAPLLAAALGRSFIETDKLVESAASMPIPEIFLQKGEAYFRRLEREVIREKSECAEPLVLSLGGGAFLWPETRDFLLERSTVFYLRAGPATLIDRLGVHVAERPLLANPKGNILETVSNLLEKRDPIYKMAHIVIESDSLSSDEVCEEILKSRELYD